ncbi:MATE family efflux transporter [Bacillus sp. FSL W8-0920]|uniref:MATE family efflux transporter n=1 Tax=Bacillus TaxID=1386 RepID=UPI002E1D1890|nr:MATE family efflux transporter [Bacillus pumilus]
MRETNSIQAKVTLFLTILIPILITQAGLSLITFLDTVMSGKVSAEDLAGVAIGSSIWTPVYTGLAGILMAVTPIVAQLMGAGHKKDVPKAVFQAIYLSFILSICVIAIGTISIPYVLGGLGLEQSVEDIARYFLSFLAFGIIPLFGYSVLRSFIDALGKTRVTMFITLTALPINFVLNNVFIFGNFGFPKLGGAGAGLASALTYWAIFIMSICIVMKAEPFASFRLFQKLPQINISRMGQILKIGLPIGFAIFFETSIFAAVTLLMGHFDTVTIASHQAAMNFASILYILPLSISMALTIVVGFEAGAKRYKDAQSYSYIGIGTAVLFSLCTAALILLFRPEIAGLYTAESAVLQLTQQFLIYAIFFQLSDAIAAPIQGALRGYKDVNYTLIAAFVSYWVIGLPSGYLIGTYTSYGAFGYWIGLIAGLAAGAIVLFIRLRLIEKRLLQQAPNH